LPEGRFLFYGFLSPKSAARRHELENFAKLRANLVLYEAPHRVLETLADMSAVFGERRRVVIAKELTKLFEAFHIAPLGEAADWFAEDPQRLKGEFVLIVEAAGDASDDAQAEAERVLKLLLADGLPVKQAAGLAAEIAGGNRKALYQAALALRQASRDGGDEA
jgi:16S rRNA (cytidine1402-2'-O)-methyltransferase